MRKRSMHELNRMSPEDFRQAPKRPIVLVMDNVRSALNVGSAFRTADGFAIEGVMLCGISACPPHREILKTALGATETVAWQFFEQAAEAVKHLVAQGYEVWAVEQAEGSVYLQDFQPPSGRPLALVFGNEVHGVSEEVMELIHGAVEIPQYGAKHSLNIAVCVGIVLWEVVRKWA